MKLCKDCRHYLPESKECGHASAVIVDYVNGNDTRFKAATHRSWTMETDCSPEARFFELLAELAGVE